MTFKRCFPPIVDAHTRVLILGSLPGEASLARSQYYAHPQNRFWHLIGDVLGVELVAMPYAQRLETLLSRGVGLWDVVAQARREGSLDSRIREHAGNDLVGLVASLPQLAVIGFNGGTAARLGVKALSALSTLPTMVILPSSSPAYTLAYAKKLDAWRALMPWVKPV